LKDLLEEIFNCLSKNDYITVEQISRRLGISTSIINKHLTTLRLDGRSRREKRGKQYIWIKDQIRKIN
jgi:biotin operon repressor